MDIQYFMTQIIYVMDQAKIRVKIRQIMLEKGLTQETLADTMGISQASLSEVLSGRRKLTYDHTEQFARALGVPEESLLPIDNSDS